MGFELKTSGIQVLFSDNCSDVSAIQVDYTITFNVIDWYVSTKKDCLYDPY